MIDKYVIMTIPRALKRQQTVIGGTLAMDVPEPKIRFFKGHDARDFDDNMLRIAEAAADDGYKFLYPFAIGMQSAWIKQSAGNVALFWNWARFLKYVADSGETTLLIWDDRIPSVFFDTLETAIAELKKKDNFYLWQLRIRGDAQLMKALKRPVSEYMDIKTQTTLFKSAVRSGNLNPKHLIQPGLLGYDESMILSPAGAAWLLKQMQTMETVETVSTGFVFTETQNDSIADVDPNVAERARLNNDNWLCWDGKLKTEVDTALKTRKGIFTTKHLGYSFVRDWVNFESDVDWATPIENPDGVITHENNKNLTQIRYLETDI